MDEPVDSLGELEENLRDIARANRWFGGIAPLAREIERLGAQSMLDVGCGGADVPRALVQRARRRPSTLKITCLDRSEQMLTLARRGAGSDPALEFVRADGTALPYDDSSFDLAMCSLVLHHLAPEEAVALLREMRRVGRLTPLVCDLRRSLTAYVATLGFVRMTTRNRLTRHDGPLSVRRAYTPSEALELARRAGWKAPAVLVLPWFRMLLVDRAREPR